MKKDIGDHLISKLDLQDIAKVLSDELSGSELNTVLLDIFNKRVQQETPSSLLSKYEGNKLVKPALLEDVLEYKEKELRCYKLIAGRGFEPIEPSPVAQFGTKKSPYFFKKHRSTGRPDEYNSITLRIVKEKRRIR